MCSEWTLLLWTGMSSRAVREERVKGRGGEGGGEGEEGRRRRKTEGHGSMGEADKMKRREGVSEGVRD